MRTVTHPFTGIVFLAVAIVLVAWQASSGRLPTGLALATPWVLSAVAIGFLGRSGAWLGALVAAASVAAAGYVFMLASGGQGRDVAEAFFASRGGSFSWADVAIVSAGLAIVSLAALAMAGRILMRPVTPTEPN